jgi:hypothetical protein
LRHLALRRAGPRAGFDAEMTNAMSVMFAGVMRMSMAA